LPRQRTLRGALDWSYELLSEEEKELFERSSVFAGGWTLEAAEAVGKGEGLEQGEVLDVLSGLAEKSLVVARGSEQGDVRYKMLEPIRQYAVEKLEEGGEAEEARHRHATFFLALAEAAEPRLRGPEDTIWLALLEAEHDNLRTALSWALGRGEIEIGLRLAGALYRLWDAHGHYREGTRWLEKALEKNVGVSGAARAKALERFGWLVYRTGGMARAVAAGEEGLELSHQAGLGGAVTADLLRLLGWMAWTKGDYGRAKGLLEESLALSRSANDRFGVADSLLMLGSTVGNLGDHKRDKQLHEEAVALCRELGYSSTLATSLFSMGYGLLVDGDYERGEALIEESAALYRERGYKGGLQFAVDNLGWAALLQGEHERARISYRESLTLCKELGDKMIASESLDGLACISAAEGEAERAAILFGAGEALFEAVGGQHEPGEAAMRQPYLAMARSRLDEIAWQEAWEEGRGMSMERAIEYAFSTEEPFATPPSSTTEQASTPEPEHLAGLTSREVEVLGLVAAGMTSVQIAENLFLSPRTVNTHINSIYHKIGVNSRAAATRFALEHGLA
jgi:DNA-binding CsgD family transcriptional regulator/tetratricopeptide (TPR) repeat protein